MGCQCSKLVPCCWGSQFKGSVLEAPDVGELNNNCRGGSCFLFFSQRDDDCA